MAKNENPRSMQYRLTPTASAVMVIILGSCLAAQAQEKTSEPKLEQVMVTANRRIERLESVPQSITVVDAALMERNNVRELVDVVNLAPALSVNIGTQVGTNSINMRGIGSTSNNLGIEGDISVIVDDMPLAQPQFGFRDMADVARIEVLKGPQSTMFGKSAIAGAVYITTTPIGNGPVEGKVSAYTTNDNEYRLSASVRGKVSDDVGLRLFASKTDFPGMLYNLTTGGRQNGSGGESLLGKFEWKVTPDLDVMIAPSYINSRATGNSFAATEYTGGSAVGYITSNKNLNLSSTAFFQGIVPSSTNRNVRLDSATGLNAIDRTLGIRINYAFPANTAMDGFALTAITSMNNNWANDFRDNDSTDLPITQYYTTNSGKVYGLNTPLTINATSDSWTQTQELRLTSPDAGAFRYLVGLWWAKNSLDRIYLRGLPDLAASNFTNYTTKKQDINRAIYANSTWEFVPSHTLTAGLRFNQEQSNYTYTTINSQTTTAKVPTGFKYTALPESNESSVTGKLAYGYAISPDMTVYATTSTGVKGVAYDMTSGANNPNAFKFLPLPQEKANTVELGLKANLWNGRATLNAALFDTNFKDYQASVTTLQSDGSSLSQLFGVPEVKTRGFEIDGKVLATRELMLSASFAYTDATIADFKQSACYSGATDCYLSTITGNTVRDASGGIMPNSPRRKMSLGAEYITPLSAIPYKLGINAQIRGQSEVIGSFSQDPATNRPGYALADLGFTLEDNKKSHKVSLGIRNLFDNQYASSQTTGFQSFKPAPGVTSPDYKTSGWVPARDAFRYFSIKLDMMF